MKIRLLSDLHIDFCPFELKYEGEDILILAGDISNNYVEAQTMIRQYLNNSPFNVIVIFVLGNHEFYNKTIQETYGAWNLFNPDPKRFYYLQNKSVVIFGVRFYGATMWTDFNEADSDSMNMASLTISDFKRIKDFDTIDCLQLHIQSKHSLKKEIKDSKEKMVVITHHLPSFKSIVLEMKDNPINSSFASTDMDEILDSDKIILFCHGHTHHSVMYTVGNTLVVCNPRGYASINEESKSVECENVKFNSNFSVELKNT
jgi:Icc-related predicted phosphoesterase